MSKQESRRKDERKGEERIGERSYKHGKLLPAKIQSWSYNQPKFMFFSNMESLNNSL